MGKHIERLLARGVISKKGDRYFKSAWIFR